MNQEKARALKLRMAKLRVEFPFKNYISVYEYEYGLLTEKEKERVRCVWASHTADELITSRFERLLENFKNG